MSKRSTPSAFWEEGYLRLTQRPLNSLLFILVPLIVYHIYALRYDTELLAPRDVGRLLRYFGATADVLPPLLILVVLALQHLIHKYPWRVQPIALGGMLIESMLWVVPLFALSHFTGRFLAATAATRPAPAVRQVLQALGAGIYEEFIFRLVFISLTLLVFVDLLGLRKELAAVAGILLGATLFSLYHLSQDQLAGAVAFPWGGVIFRAMAGVYLGGLYVCRGFGIAAGTHAFWNICVALLGR
ncbi:MAG: CPBP family intramembrane glutamic endopeptidase [Phycisphaerae bacterium]